MEGQYETKKRRHDFARKVDLPPSPACRADVVRRLTRDIQKIAVRHIGRDPQHWRDQRARKSLEAKINLRAEVLKMLQEQDPGLFNQLRKEIEEG